MNSLLPFNFENTAIRTTLKGDVVWFSAADICTALGVKNHRDSLMNLDDDEKGVVSTDTLGGKQEISVVNESGLYALVLRSRKPAARKFVKWVTGEVLPAIRKTGTYTLTINPEQQRAIQEAVNAYVIKHQTTHQSVYHSIKTKFKVAKYDQLPAAQFAECTDYLEGNEQPKQLSSADFWNELPKQIAAGNGYPVEVLMPIYWAIHKRVGGSSKMMIERSRMIDVMRDLKTLEANMGRLWTRMDYMALVSSDISEECWQRQALAM